MLHIVEDFMFRLTLDLIQRPKANMLKDNILLKSYNINIFFKYFFIYKKKTETSSTHPRSFMVLQTDVFNIRNLNFYSLFTDLTCTLLLTHVPQFTAKCVLKIIS